MTERDIFITALQKDDADARRAYLAEACGSDAALRARVEELLAVHERAASFLESPPVRPAATMDSPIVEEPGTVIGPYKLLEPIGEGGFGVVFLAEQAEPVRRKVALKVLKPGMDTRQVVARFEAERQALAIMDHPNIAKVFDGGATPSGRPYFVMELVKGTPLTDFCDQHHLTPRERLELFVPVCQAVQHAHQKGIIHRDLKPSNVLVSRHDTTPVVKVIDFGVAKALGQSLTDKTLFTGVAQMIGTPLYMSPEQAGMSDLDVDTRSDIYSLGVLLYELLTGTTPFTKERFRQAAYDEIRRIIREEEPPKPSTRLSDSTASLPSVSALRQTEPARLTKLVRGELDWIVMKALEKDRTRRYETANGFAADVLRYLADEPVLACPPSAGYRLRKFVRRNKGGLVVAALVLLFLVVLGSGAGWAWRDRSAREAEAARQRGERQAKAGGQVESIFAEVDGLEREQKWPEALAAARQAEAIVAGGEVDAATAERVRDRLKGPEFLDRLERVRMAATWVGGRLNAAGTDREYAQLFRQYGVDVDELPVEVAIDRLKSRPALVVPIAAALDDWAQTRWNAQGGQGGDATAKRLVTIARGIDPDPLRDRVRATWRRVTEMGDELRRVADSIDIRAEHPATLVILHWKLRVTHPDRAVLLLRDAQRAHPGDFWVNFYLARLLNVQKDYEGAVRFYTAAAAVRPQAVAVLNNLGTVLKAQNKLDEAIAVYRRALEVEPNLAAALNNLGVALTDQKKFDEAIACYFKALKLDPGNAGAHNNLGTALSYQGKHQEAVAAFRRAIDLDPKLANAHYNLGQKLYAQGKMDEAIASFRKVIALQPENPNAHLFVGACLANQGKYQEAIAAYHRTIDLDSTIHFAHANLGHCLHMLGKQDEAVAAIRRAIKLAPKDPLAHNNLGSALAAQRKYQEAIAAYRTAIEHDANHANAHNNLAWQLATCADAKLRDPDLAVSHARKAVELDRMNAVFHKVLGVALYRAGDWKAAIAAIEKSLENGRAGNGIDWFFLAMAHWQLGEKAKARESYDRAVQWFDKHRPAHEEMHRFRAEAEALLGVKGKNK